MTFDYRTYLYLLDKQTKEEIRKLRESYDNIETKCLEADKLFHELSKKIEVRFSELKFEDVFGTKQLYAIVEEETTLDDLNEKLSKLTEEKYYNPSTKKSVYRIDGAIVRTMVHNMEIRIDYPLNGYNGYFE
jgi:DNA repair exonuclease SbcCD ATPase subunit